MHTKRKGHTAPRGVKSSMKKTKKNARALLTLALAALMLLGSCFFASAENADEITYLVLGDSISTGYGLAGYTPEAHSAKGFAYRTAADLGYTIVNKAKDGNTSEDILAQLTESSHEKHVSAETLAEADVITITVGGNDLMALLYKKIAEQTSEKSDTAEDIPLKLMEGDREALTAAINLLNEKHKSYVINDPDFTAAIKRIIANINVIVEKIRSVNTHAPIVIATQYNPYVEFDGAKLLILDLSPVCNGMEAGVTALNAAIKSNAAGKYTVNDVKKAFDAYTGTKDLYNAEPPVGSSDINVDFHPTADGHALIASTLKSTLATLDIKNKLPEAEISLVCDASLGTVLGGGKYTKGESVTVTATPREGAVFEYWVKAEIAADGTLTAEELGKAILSRESTYTFTAEESAELKAVFSPAEIKASASIIADTDAESLKNAAALEYAFSPIPAGTAEVKLPGEFFAKYIRHGGKIYAFAGFLLGEGDGVSLVKELTVGEKPLFGSAEWKAWLEPIEHGIKAAYTLHTHSELSTESDESAHWQKCACGEVLNRTEHNYTKFESKNELLHRKTCEECGHSADAEHDIRALEDKLCTFACTACGLTDESASAHDYTELVPSAQSPESGHEAACKFCGKISAGAEPAAHKFSFAQSESGHVKTCAECGYTAPEKCTLECTAGAESHSFTCKECGKTGEPAAHDDADGDGKCDACGEALASGAPWLPFAIGGAAIAAAAAVAAVIIAKKKKSKAE